MDEQRLIKRYEREKTARLEAERILEEKSRELFDRNAQLKILTEGLEILVEDRTKDLMQARDEALSAAKAKSQFMANMSHEVRTPLNGVIGMLNMLTDMGVGSAQQELLDTAIRSGQTLLEIVNDILDFSKIDAGQMTLHEMPISLRTLFEDTMAPMHHVAGERNIKLVTVFPDDFPEFILADGLRVRQILTNLLSNSLKFTIQGEVKTVLSRTAQGFEIVISDTGIGMSQEQVERIFSAFGQADGSITRQFGGTGLGLTITQSFVNMMGGAIAVDSQLGEGTIFTVRLPLVETEAPVAELNNQEISEYVKFEESAVLVVEDNEVNQAVATHLLNRANISVDICHNGEEALTQVQLKPYKAVLMDIQMPVMDGLEATRQIRAFGSHYVDIPIVAMTAHATQEHRKESFEAGMNEHISKPVDPLELYRILSRYISVEAVDARKLNVAETMTVTPAEKSADDRPSNDEAEATLKLPERLEGLEISEALGRLGGNQKLYLKILTTFYQTQSSLVQDVEEALANNDTDRARLLLHTTKGSAANISANDLSSAAAQFERAILDGELDDLQTLVLQLAHRWSVVDNAILGLINEFVIVREQDAAQESRQESSMSDREAVDLLRQIYGLLNQDISKVEALVEMFNARHYAGHHKPLIETLVQQLDVFDVAGAEKTLSVLFEEFDI